VVKWRKFHTVQPTPNGVKFKPLSRRLIPIAVHLINKNISGNPQACANPVFYDAFDLNCRFEIPHKHQTQRICENPCNSCPRQAGVDSHLRIENPLYRFTKLQISGSSASPSFFKFLLPRNDKDNSFPVANRPFNPCLLSLISPLNKILKNLNSLMFQYFRNPPFKTQLFS
jgi:hypothetical protein